MLGHKLFFLCLFFWHRRSVFSTTAVLKPLYFCVKPRSDASRSAWDLIFSSFADQQLQAQSKPSGKLLLLFIQGSFTRAHPLLSQQCPFFFLFFAYTQTPPPTHTHTQNQEKPSPTAVFYSCGFTAGAFLRDTLAVAVEQRETFSWNLPLKTLNNLPVTSVCITAELPLAPN